MSSRSESAGTPSTPNLAPLWPMLWRQTRVELLRLWRTPSFFVPTLLLPIVLYTLLGGLGKGSTLEDGVSRQTYALASVGTYGTIGVMLYSFGVSMANERAQRVNVLMRATPLPATIYLLAKIITALLSAVVMVTALSVFAILAGGVHLSLGAWATLLVSLVLGAIPFLCWLSLPAFLSLWRSSLIRAEEVRSFG
jgi:ABC-2 type transport system permease protein